jgi:hypothetical protein
MDEGWKPVAIEWERPAVGEGGSEEVKHQVPYGLQVSEDCHYLEENRTEKEALRLMLALIVDDKPLSRVADELNRRGFRMRNEAEWNQVAVFNALPRLIEVAPEFLSAEEWTASKQRILKAV